MFDFGCPRGRVRQNDGAMAAGHIVSYRAQSVMAGHSASEDARERAYVPAIHVFLA
jgi:hypothetical protein